MARQRRHSTVSAHSQSDSGREQELGSMYDYLAKVILLGPSGCGKSCLLHRFVKKEWRVLSSQTIGVEFASKIVRVGREGGGKRIKLQLWDTAGTERFRSVSRSYYRGAAGAILVYDISSQASFAALPTFLSDARALASPHLTLLLAGNKADLAEEAQQQAQASDTEEPSYLDDGDSRPPSSYPSGSLDSNSSLPPALGTRQTATVAPDGREIPPSLAQSWASAHEIPVCVEVSALSGSNVDALFTKLAQTILTKIELGEIDPDDPLSGIQYGDCGGWAGTDDGGSVKSGFGAWEGTGRRRRRGGTGLREWEEVFRLTSGRRGWGCC
ncbi:hypothetical protein LTR66_005730 [Elasticomyces elasticus]|nr:hypothetical protein LTR66_005730 [Elasticomyces elasticus]